MALDEIEDDADDDDAPIHYARPIHARGRDRNRRREEGENEGNGGVDCGKDVNWKTPCTERPGTEGDRLMAQSFGDQDDDRDEVRGAVACHDERYESVKRNQGPNVDETEERIYCNAETYGPEWDGVVVINLQYVFCKIDFSMRNAGGAAEMNVHVSKDSSPADRCNGQKPMPVSKRMRGCQTWQRCTWQREWMSLPS